METDHFLFFLEKKIEIHSTTKNLFKKKKIFVISLNFEYMFLISLN
jgi:hypothetical protein